MKRFIAILLCAVLAFSVPLCVSAEDDDSYDYVDLLAQYTTKQVVEMFPQAAQYLASELRKLNDDISLREFNVDIKYIDSLFFSVLCENPDIFYVNPRYFESTVPDESNYLISVRPFYFFDAKNIASETKKFESACDDILKGIDKSWSDLVKIRYIHDMIATTCEYDMDLYNEDYIIYTAYGALVNRNAVCEGYTLAYRYLLSKLGIETRYVLSRKMEHAWAMVKLDGNYYHVDITHDDPSYDNLGRVNHEYFLKSDRSFTLDSDHHDWISDIKASDTSYDNMWWNDINTIIFNVDGNDYYVNQYYGSSIYGAFIERTPDGSTCVLARVTKRWLHKDKTNGAFWERSFVYLAWDGEYFYYNDTGNIYRQKPDSAQAQIVYEKPASLDNDIYGLVFRADGTMYITAKKYPDTSDEIYKLSSLAPIRWVNAIQDSSNTYPSGGSTSSDSPNAPTGPSQNGSVIVIKKTAKQSLYVNQTSKINVEDKTVVFKSSNKKIATVNKNGKITAKKKGTVTITAKGDTIDLKVTVTVKNPKLKIKSKKLNKGSTYKVVVVGKYGKATYKSSNPKVASVTSSGKIKAKKKGNAVITIKIGTAKLKLKVKVNN
ncbi:MAG: Ig-like domain-containing protein [Ruminococcus sp.]|nr:Ig-like domain-containing protein [Ruminococcus sp.]